MYSVPLVLALAAAAVASSNCVASPFDGHELQAAGYPVLNAAYDGSRVDIVIQMNQVRLTDPRALHHRHPTCAFWSRNETTNPVTLVFNNSATFHEVDCVMTIGARFNITELLKGAGWYKTEDPVWNVYTFTVAVSWVDYVYIYDPEKGITPFTPVAEREMSSHLHFNILVQRLVVVDTDISFLTPVTMYALTKRMEVDLTPVLHVDVRLEIRVYENYKLTNANVTDVAGAIVGLIGSIDVSGKTDGTWSIYTLSFALEVTPSTCTFTDTSSAYNLSLRVEDRSESHIWYQIPLLVAVTASENWCSTEVTSVGFVGVQYFFKDPAMATLPVATYWLNDTVYVGSQWSNNASIPFRVVDASATATAHFYNSSFDVPLTFFDECPNASSFLFCFSFFLDPYKFVSLYHYDIAVTYSLLADGGRRRRVSDVYSLSTSLYLKGSSNSKIESTKVESGKTVQVTPRYMVGVMGALAGFAGLSIVVAVSAVSYLVISRRRQPARALSTQVEL